MSIPNPDAVPLEHQESPEDYLWLAQLLGPGPVPTGDLLVSVSMVLSGAISARAQSEMFGRWCSGQPTRWDGPVALQQLVMFLGQSWSSRPEKLDQHTTLPLDRDFCHQLAGYVQDGNWETLKTYLRSLWERLAALSECLRQAGHQTDAVARGVSQGIATLQILQALDPSLAQSQAQYQAQAASQHEILQKVMSSWELAQSSLRCGLSNLVEELSPAWLGLAWLRCDIALSDEASLATVRNQWAERVFGWREQVAMAAIPLWNARSPEVDLVEQIWLALAKLQEILQRPGVFNLTDLNRVLDFFVELQTATSEFFDLSWPELPVQHPWRELKTCHEASRYHSSAGRWWRNCHRKLKPMLEFLYDDVRVEIIESFDGILQENPERLLEFELGLNAAWADLDEQRVRLTDTLEVTS